MLTNDTLGNCTYYHYTCRHHVCQAHYHRFLIWRRHFRRIYHALGPREQGWCSILWGSVIVTFVGQGVLWDLIDGNFRETFSSSFWDSLGFGISTTLSRTINVRDIETAAGEQLLWVLGLCWEGFREDWVQKVANDNHFFV
jgi:hypothetical protein